MPITSLRRSDRCLAGSGSTHTSVPSGKFASGGRTTVPFETTPTNPITTSRLSTRIHYTFNPPLSPSEAWLIKLMPGNGNRFGRMKSGCVSDSTRAAGRRLAEAYQTALANFGSQARQPLPCGVHPKTETEKIGKIGKIGTRVPVPLFPSDFGLHERVTGDQSPRVLCHHKLPRGGLRGTGRLHL